VIRSVARLGSRTLAGGTREEPTGSTTDDFALLHDGDELRLCVLREQGSVAPVQSFTAVCECVDPTLRAA